MQSASPGAARICVLALILNHGSAAAIEFDLGSAAVTLNNRLTYGAAWRIEPQDERLIGKLNVEGQQGLCPDDCISYTGDPEPNLRLVRARGAFSGSNQDNGDLNYKPGDMVASTSMLDSSLSVGWGEYVLKLRGLAYLDPYNLNFNETHPDTRYQPAKSPRGGEARQLTGRGGELLDGFVASHFTLGEYPVSWSLGYQRLRWGESTSIALDSLNEINPPDGRRLHQPGVQLDQIFRPVPLVTLGTQLASGLSIDVLYQLAWSPVVADPAGSYYGTNDILNGGTYLMDSLGQFSEDPGNIQQLPGIGDLVSDTGLSSPVLARQGRPRNSGQYGLKLNNFFDQLNGGTEVSLYYLNYHSRLPLMGGISANQSCTRKADDPENIFSVFFACDGFKANPDGLEPLPIDSVKLLLQYPENIHMFGASFNTNFGSWSLAGEYSFRPNVPVQVHLTDMLYATLQQAFPSKDVVLNARSVIQDLGGLLNTGVLDPQQDAALARLLAYYLANPATYTLPSAQRAVPTYLESYRGITYGPNQVVDGYQRLQVGQLDLTAIRAFSSSDLPIGADQLILVLEGGFTQVYNMPPRSAIQFDGGGANRTHASPGADGTGSGGVPDPSRLTPTQQTTGFADAFAWGYRMLLRAEYNDVFAGVNLKPQLYWQHDVGGIAVLPMQNFVEGRMEWNLTLEATLGNHYSTSVFWQDATGGGSNNLIRDRGELGVSFAYTF